MAVLGSLVSGIFGLGANGINANLQRETNEMNYRINQMNNEFNAREAQKNRDFQLDMWNRQNEYNTPSAQFQRMKDAGINPYNAAGSVSTGISSSSPSGASASAASPVAMQAYRHDFSSVSDAINSFFVNQKIARESQGLSIQNANMSDLMRAQIVSAIGNQSNPLMNNPKYRSWLLSEAGANLGMSSYRNQVQSQNLNNQLTVANTIGILLDNRYKQVVNKFANSNQMADLQIKLAQYRQLVANGSLTWTKVKSELVGQLRTMAETAKVRLDTRILSETADALIRATNLSNDVSSSDDQSRLDYREGIRGSKAGKWIDTNIGSGLEYWMHRLFGFLNFSR